jgi:hypothetical protein
MTNKEIYCTHEKDGAWKTPFIASSISILDFAFDALTHAEFKMLMFVARNGHRSYVSNRFIANGLYCSSSTVHRCMAVLVHIGLVEHNKKGYRTKYLEDVTKLKNVSIVETVDGRSRCLVNRDTPVSLMETSPSRSSIQREEALSTRVKRRGGEEAPPATPLRLVEKSKIVDYETELLDQIHLTKVVDIPVLGKEYFNEGEEFPVSFVPNKPSLQIEERGLTQVVARLNFLYAVNIMCDLQSKQGSKFYCIPQGPSDVRNLGDVVASFVGVEDWVEHFSTFYQWVLDNKKDVAYNRLGFYFSDWTSMNLSARGYSRAGVK